jgi:hypothetical protein
MFGMNLWWRFAFFFRGSFGLADSDQEFCLRSGQLASTGSSATPANHGEVFADLARQGYSFTVHDSYRKPFTIHSASIQMDEASPPPVRQGQADPSGPHALIASGCG